MEYNQWQSRQNTQFVETEHHEFDVAYNEEGSGDPITLFIHGIPTWSFLFRHVYDGVNHALLPDLAGYGFTRHIGPGGYDRTIREQEDLIIDFLEKLEIDSVQVVGHDIGGGVASRLAINTDYVEKLIITNGVSYDSWPGPAMWTSVDEHPSEFFAKEWTQEEVVKHLNKVIEERFHNEEELTNDFSNGIKAPFIEGPRDPADFAWDLVSLNTNQTLELTPYYNEIECPTLLLWGKADPRQHTDLVKKLSNDIPDTKTKFLEKSSHWSMQEQPNTFKTELSKFLTE